VADRSQLLERTEELSVLEGALSSLVERQGALLLVEGEPGIGKSSLLRHAQARAEGLGLRVLSASGVQLEEAVAFGLLRQLLLPAALAAPDLLDGPAAALGSALGLEVGSAELGELSAVGHALYWFVVALCEQSPLVLVVDDLHWADRASRQALVSVSSRLEGLPVVLLLGTRPRAEVGLELDQALRSPAARELRPAGLSEDAVRLLVEQRLSGEQVPQHLAGACVELTGGVPFLVLELLDELAAEGVALGSEAVSRMRALAPRGVQRGVLARLHAVSDEARSLARAVAVVPPAVAPHLAAAIAGLDADASRRAVQELVAAHLLVEEDLLRAAHPVVGTAVYEDVPRQERAALHGRAAGVLRDAGASREVCASHLVHTLPAGEPAVARELHEVGVAALEAGATDAAVRLLERALAEPPLPARRAAVLADLGWAARFAGREDALAHLRAAHAAADLPEERALAAARMAELQVMEGGEAEEAWALVHRSLGELGSHDEQRLRLAARMYLLADRRTASGTAASAIAATVPRDLDGSTPGRRACLYVLAIEASVGGGHVDEVRAAHDRAGYDLAGLWPEGHDGVLEAINAVAGLRCSGQLTQSLHLSEQLTLRLQDAGRGAEYAWALAQQGTTLLRLGRAADAQAAAESALAVVEGAGPGFATAIATVSCVRVLVQRAELDRAELLLAELAPLEGHVEAARLTSQAELLAARGRLDEAVRLHLRAGELLRPLTGLNPAVDEWGRDVVLLLAALDRREEARSLLDDCLTRARAFGFAAAIGWLRRAEGVLERAPEPLHEAIALLADSEFRLQHAEAVVDLGRVLRRCGQDRQAREHLAQGLAMAQEQGALLLLDLAREELRLAGGRSVDRARRGPGALTPSEARVAHLAAEGLPNKEIAQRLFVTLRTVETHLNSAYRKLSVGSRRDLGRALEREAGA
jgi:DNA-binding CsgD family transcriptional regulator